tara:strand:+ start:923 stop:2191 length:1269 start_codon:yes stop_codon:yes gene_type:complete
LVFFAAIFWIFRFAHRYGSTSLPGEGVEFRTDPETSLETQNLVNITNYCKFRKGISYKGQYIGEPGPGLLGIGTIREGGGFRSDKVRTYGGPYKGVHEVRSGDVYVALTSQDGLLIGSTAKIPDSFEGNGIVTHHTAKVEWTTDDKEIQDFIYWKMNSLDFINHCQYLSYGTTVYAVSPRDVERYLVPNNLTPEQKKKISLLNNLNKLRINTQSSVELNTSTINEVFIEFYLKSNGNSGELTPLKNLAKIKTDSINPLDFPDEKYTYYSIPSFDLNQEPVVTRGSEIKSNKYLIPDDSILISKLNPRFKRIWNPSSNSLHPSICSTEFLPLLPNDVSWKYFFFCLLNSHDFYWELRNLVTGTTGSHQRVRKQDIEKILIRPPSDKCIKQLNNLITPLFEKLKEDKEKISRIQIMMHEIINKL